MHEFKSIADANPSSIDETHCDGPATRDCERFAHDETGLLATTERKVGREGVPGLGSKDVTPTRRANQPTATRIGRRWEMPLIADK